MSTTQSEKTEKDDMKEEKKSEPMKRTTSGSGKTAKPAAKPSTQKSFFANFNAGAKKQQEKVGTIILITYRLIANR